MWLKRRWILGRVQRFKVKKRVHSLNSCKILRRACVRQGIKAPNIITRDELNIELKTCKHKSKELEQSAPRLWLEHLLKRRQNALKRGEHIFVIKLDILLIKVLCTVRQLDKFIVFICDTQTYYSSRKCESVSEPKC